MTQIAAVPIGRITGGDLTEDGQHLLVRTVAPDGKEVVLALHREQMLPLVDMAAFGFTKGGKTLKVSPDLKFSLEVSWWELSFERDTGRAILSLTFGAGGRLDFRLAPAMPEQILETLQAHFAPPAPRRPGKSVN
jgi:hypothetical protein